LNKLNIDLTSESCISFVIFVNICMVEANRIRSHFSICLHCLCDS
jgi:hypothetical protein